MYFKILFLIHLPGDALGIIFVVFMKDWEKTGGNVSVLLLYFT